MIKCRTGILLAFSLVLLQGLATAQDPDYSIENLNPELLTGASIVIRNHVLEFHVKDMGSATEKVLLAKTILKEAGRNMASHYIWYDDNVKVKSVSGEIIDKNGKLIRKMKSTEIQDKSAVSGFSLYEDNRVKILDLSHPHYPFTVVYEYEIERRGLLFYPYWIPQSSNEISVENAEFIVSVPQDNDLRFLQRGFDNDPEVSYRYGLKEYLWKLENLKAFEQEPFAPYFEDLVPSVRTAPLKFEMEGYTGSMETWDELGKWQIQLNEGLQNLPDHVVQEIVGLISDESDPRRKIRLIYEYMQANTRYVSVQLGIGGWQPYDANYVAENGYGDCKALTNYTQSLLGAVGIKGYYTLIRAGRNEPNIRTDFPSRQFNHVILTVPLDTDTVWLECTSQTNPFGFTGYFTYDRDALMITGEGGKIIHTPVLDANDNIQHRLARIYLSEEGSATIYLQTSYQGLQYENVNDLIGRSEEDKKKWLYNNLNLTKFEIRSFGYEEIREANPEIKEEIEIVVSKLTTNTGKRMFVMPNIFNRITNWPKELDNRRSPVVVRHPFTDLDSIRFILPDKMHIEVLPDEVNLVSPFGEYSTKYIVEENELVYIRRLIWKGGSFPADSYNELVEFLKNIANHDSSKVVLLNST